MNIPWNNIITNHIIINNTRNNKKTFTRKTTGKLERTLNIIPKSPEWARTCHDNCVYPHLSNNLSSFHIINLFICFHKTQTANMKS